MVLRRIPGLVVRVIVRDARRDADRTARSVDRNVRRVLGRPVRTTLSIVFVTLLFGVLYTISMDQGAVNDVDAAGGDALATALAILPPLPILALIALAMLVLVPVALVSQGVKNDLRYNR